MKEWSKSKRGLEKTAEKKGWPGICVSVGRNLGRQVVEVNARNYHQVKSDINQW